MSKTKFDLNRHTARLLMDEPFFAALSRRIDKVETTQLPTAGMRLNDDGFFTMLYNPDYFAKLEDDEMADVLKHEFYHVIFEHVTGRLPEKEVTLLWNFATDLAINSHLKNLPEGALIPGEGPFADMPPGLSAEQYHAALKKRQKEEEDMIEEGEEGEEGSGQKKLQDVDDFDNHDGWGESQGAAPQIAKERLKNMVRDAAKEASTSGSWGSVPEKIKKDILARVDGTLDWRKPSPRPKDKQTGQHSHQHRSEWKCRRWHACCIF